MAEAFLSQLLRVENSVQPTSSERCIICFTECGTLCDQSGIVEFEIRLPCTHKVGSRCIATWLDPTGAANNSCPVCRYVFFPPQPRPYLEHEIETEDEDDAMIMADFDGYNIPANYTPIPTNWNSDRLWINGAGNSDEEGNSEDVIPEPPVPANSLRRSRRLQGISA